MVWLVKIDRWMLALAAAAMTLMLAGCSEAPPARASAPKEVSAPPAGTTLSRSDEPVLGSGPIVVENQVDLTAPREGVIATIEVETGVPVRRGQLLGTLDASQILADAEAAEAKAKSVEADVKNWEAETKVAEADAQRAQGMWDSQLITKQDLDHARYKVEASRFEVEREKENLHNARAQARSLAIEATKTKIVAPFDGVVARRYVRTGQRVTKDEKLFWVSATSPLRVRFMVPEAAIRHVQKGTTLEVSASSSPDERHVAKVIAVSPIVDPASGTVEAVAEIEQHSAAGMLLPGMMADVRLPKK